MNNVEGLNHSVISNNNNHSRWRFKLFNCSSWSQHLPWGLSWRGRESVWLVPEELSSSPFLSSLLLSSPLSSSPFLSSLLLSPPLLLSFPLLSSLLSSSPLLSGRHTLQPELPEEWCLVPRGDPAFDLLLLRPVGFNRRMRGRQMTRAQPWKFRFSPEVQRHSITARAGSESWTIEVSWCIVCIFACSEVTYTTVQSVVLFI